MTKRTLNTLALATALIAYVGLLYGVNVYYRTDTTDWFTPESNAPVLEVYHNGTGQTVNPQKTITAAELQGGEL